MTRKELALKIAEIVHGDYSRYTSFDPEEDKTVKRILRVVDGYLASEVLKNKELTVQKIDLQGQPLFPTPTCPSCGSKEYTISSNSAGNIRCSKCGKYFFFIFSRSL